MGVAVPPHLEEVFSVCCSSGSECMNLTEFIACMLPENVLTDQLCAAAFYFLDRDHNGIVETKDFQLLYEAGSVPGHACESILPEAVGKDAITAAEFKRFLQNLK